MFKNLYRHFYFSRNHDHIWAYGAISRKLGNVCKKSIEGNVFRRDKNARNSYRIINIYVHFTIREKMPIYGGGEAFGTLSQKQSTKCKNT